ncbi:MAG: hypothetical protein ABR991_12410 [Terracidiphilus sp.]
MEDSLQFDQQIAALEKLAAARDRLYTERHESMQRLIDTALDGQRDALDKAFAASQSALTNEHLIIMEKLDALKSFVGQAQEEIEKLRSGASRTTGREGPIDAAVKWAAGLLAIIIVALVAHLWK